ncbi:MAG: peptide deformylase [Planctomycetes bacterium]|nr:peptide deformylase [Planctomycetota bacterium]
MEVLIYPHPILRRGGQVVTTFDAELRQLSEQMMEAMYEEGGVGLAAPQVGIEKKLLVLNPSGDRNERSGELTLCNPKITKKKGRDFEEEGCLSFPGIHAEVERWVTITVTFQDLDGKEGTLHADGWLARIIQHELDHLEGVVFTDRLTAAEKLRVKAPLQELEERYRAQV